MQSEWKFSDALLQVIQSCGVSHRTLCQRTGISESAMIRFLVGKRGFTLENLDKLADTLGIVLDRNVHPTMPSPAPGCAHGVNGDNTRSASVIAQDNVYIVAAPQKSGGKQAFFAEKARQFAKTAYENFRESRRGTLLIEKQGKQNSYIVLYNNNPYETYPERRAQEVAALRKYLASRP